MAETERSVLVAGGGIGGLSAAIALSKRGLAATVLERNSFTEESGAGIQLGPNATRILRAQGVLEAIEGSAFRPEAIWLFDGISGRKLATVPLGDYAEERYGAPYLTLHRADLHAGLLAVCEALPGVTLTPRFDVARITTADTRVTVENAGGVRAEGDMLIGADGLWSKVREIVVPDSLLHFSGDTAYRALLPRGDLPAPFDAAVVGLWLGPKAHLVHYPVRGGEALNVVAVTSGGQEAQGWNRSGDSNALRAGFTQWCKESKSLVERDEAWRCWSLFGLAPLRAWSKDRIVLLGDAAHPVLPYLAQGAGLAIEDAAALAEALASTPDDISAAFARYQAARRPRAARVQRQAQRLGRLYHLRGPARLARNIVLGGRDGRAALRQFDWLYGAKA